jgi:diguanylate cyclase (GGDEF)-like protein/PAS domain S-box-containing protein
MEAGRDMRADCGGDGQVSSLGLHAAALESLPHGLCTVDSEQRVSLFNTRYAEMFGLASGDIQIGMPFLDVLRLSAKSGNILPSQVEDAYARRLEQMAGGEPFRTLRQLSNGRTFAMSYRPLGGGQWVTLVEDVTDRQRQEYDLRIRFERVYLAVNHMSHGLCVTDGDNRIALFNQRFLDMYGLSADVVEVGVHIRDLIEHGAQRGFFPKTAVERIWQRRLEKMAARKPYQQYQNLNTGREYILHYHPMDDGGWVTLCEDVTERFRMERELRLQHDRFDQAVNHMSHGLCLFGPDERLIACNAQHINIFGLDPAVVKPGIPLRELIAHWVASGNASVNSVEEFYEQRKGAVTGDSMSKTQLLMKDGRVIEQSSRPTPDGGWVSAHEDVTERLRYEAVLREQNILFDAALESMAHGICVFDKDWRVVVYNRRYQELYGHHKLLKAGTPVLDLIRFSMREGVHVRTGEEVTPEEFFEDFKRRVEANGDEPIVRRFADGRLMALRHRPMQNGGWVCTFEDITERERAANELKEQHRRFDIALNNMAHGLCMFDADMRLIVSNKRYAEMFNLPAGFVRPGMSIREVIEKSHALGNYRHRDVTPYELYDSYVQTLKAGDLVVHRHLADGRMIKLTHEPMADGGWVAIYEDITERYLAEQSIAHMARHDALTGLPNRVLFRERMDEGLSRVGGMGEVLALLCLDLDNFKAVNDTLGHPIGDRLLGTIADRIGSVVAETDTVARLGGDEFAILLSKTSPQAAAALARSLVEVISTPIEIDGHEINSAVSIGIVLAPNDGNAADHLMKCADLALYRAKAEGRGTFRFFEPDMDACVQRRRALEVDLRRALTAGEFSLVYQPQINLVTNELVAMEALLRWTHAERGSVPPAEFIPLAEEMGLIVPLGEWVLREACREAANWPEAVKVAVNLSPVQFRNRALVTTVTHALAAARLAPRRLELEITEAVLLQDDEATLAMLHQLRALGVRVAMDDFGTGYSSLSYLRSFPFDKIKIDRSFIKDIDRNRDSAVIIKAIASLGASLGIETTAEGIETADQLELVRRAGCTEMQGYLVSPPRPAAEAADLIARFRREVVAA